MEQFVPTIFSVSLPYYNIKSSGITGVIRKAAI
jgi:hypothetical protein